MTTPATPVTDNPYGLAALWAQGDWIAKATLILLLIMSLYSWYVILTKWLAQQRVAQQAAKAQSMLEAGLTRSMVDKLPASSPHQWVASAALDAVSNHHQVSTQMNLNEWTAQNVEQAVAQVQSDTQSGLAVLATVGSTAPFVGLFGTVWGIYHALVAIGVSGQASLDRVAGPVGEALIMTAIGLAVAVPAVLAYNWLVRRNKVNMDKLRQFGSHAHTEALKFADRQAKNRVAAAQNT